jgi:hypothetical protein
LLLICWMYHQHLSGIHPNTGQTSLQENAQSLLSPSTSHFLSCFSNHQSTHKGGLSRIDSWVQLIFEDKQLYNDTNTLLKPIKSSVPLLWVSQYTYLWNCRNKSPQQPFEANKTTSAVITFMRVTNKLSDLYNCVRYTYNCIL